MQEKGSSRKAADLSKLKRELKISQNEWPCSAINVGWQFILQTKLSAKSTDQLDELIILITEELA